MLGAKILFLAFLASQVFAATRDKYTWPFASYSIWNLPIGADATYVDAKLGNMTSGLHVDPDLILFYPNAPVQNIYYSSALWTKASRCTPDSGNKVLYSVPMPNNFIVPSDGNNYGAAILLQDNNTIVQTQPLCRCTDTSPWTSGDVLPKQYLDQEGIYGAHGGSGLSAVGGTIRLGEWKSGNLIRHALKINLDANLHYYRNPCYRWPASDCDGYHETVYNGTVPQLVPGSLLALPASLNINNLNLETVPGKSLAWTLQNYGGYISDDTWYWNVFTVEMELSPAGDVRNEFEQLYGYSLWSTGNAWARDINKIYQNLHVVDSWTYDIYNRVKASNGKEGSGGGSPRQPWAPPLSGSGTTTTGGPVKAYTIFDDSLTSGWSLSAGNGGSVSLTSSVKYMGHNSEKLTTSGPWQNYQFYNNGFSLAGYTYLHVAILSGQSADVCFSFQVFDGQWTSSIPIAYASQYGGNPTSGEWMVYNIPLEDLTSSSIIQNIYLQDCSGSGGHIFYLDQLQFTTGSYLTTGLSSLSTSGKMIV